MTTDRLQTLADVVLDHLREREDALHVPLLGDNVLAVVSIVQVPLWATYDHGLQVLAILESWGEIERVEEDELLPLAGTGLPLRIYWPEGTVHGWRVVR